MPSPSESVERARTKGTCFCSISSLLFLLGRVSLQNTKNDWWPWKLFRSVGWNCSHERTPIHCSTIVLPPPPPPTFSVPNEVLPLLSYSLPPSLTHSLGAQKDTSAVVEARNMEGQDGRTGLKIEPSLVVVRRRRRFLTCATKCHQVSFCQDDTVCGSSI